MALAPLRSQCQFGMINMETQRFHKGYIDNDGNMCYEKHGEPAMLPCEINVPSSPKKKSHRWRDIIRNMWK